MIARTGKQIVAAGIDIGGTYIKATTVSRDGAIVADRHCPTSQDRATLVDTVRRLLGELGCAGLPVGIASPGLADKSNRFIRWMRGRMECLEGLDWSEALRRPVAVLNDAHAATMGEAWCGAAAGKKHVVMLTLGTGVGGGAIVDGRLLQGAIGRAGHLGHVSLNPDGPLDIVNTPGSLEDLVGNHTISVRTGGRFTSTADLVKAASHDREAARIWAKTIRALASGVVSFINAFDPEIVVIGGGIALAGSALFDPLTRELNQLEWRPLGSPVPIVPAVLGDAAGAIGAAHFAASHAHNGIKTS